MDQSRSVARGTVRRAAAKPLSVVGLRAANTGQSRSRFAPLLVLQPEPAVIFRRSVIPGSTLWAAPE
jgi:hypothetical protein